MKSNHHERLDTLPKGAAPFQIFLNSPRWIILEFETHIVIYLHSRTFGGLGRKLGSLKRPFWWSRWLLRAGHGVDGVIWGGDSNWKGCEIAPQSRKELFLHVQLLLKVKKISAFKKTFNDHFYGKKKPNKEQNNNTQPITTKLGLVCQKDLEAPPTSISPLSRASSFPLWAHYCQKQ